MEQAMSDREEMFCEEIRQQQLAFVRQQQECIATYNA
jgi:hypothetical protein